MGGMRMSMHVLSKSCAALLVASLGAVVCAATAIGSQVPDSPLKFIGLDSTVSLRSVAAGHRFTVLAFLKADEEIYSRRIARIAPTFQNKDVGFLAIFSAGSEASVAARAKGARIPFNALLDKAGSLYRTLGLSDAARVAIVDNTGVLLYRGLIDDNADPVRVRNPYLVEALMRLLAGRSVEAGDTEGR